MSTTKYFDLADEEATKHFGGVLATMAKPCDVMTLKGSLGAGKTTLARAFIQSLTNPTQEVPSPTFTLVQIYQTPIGLVWHFDLYRLNNCEEIFELGFDEATNTGICLIEWPEKLGAYLPTYRLDIDLQTSNIDTHRGLTLTSYHQWDERIADLIL